MENKNNNKGDKVPSGDYILARKFKMSELPGYLWKYLPLYPGQRGLVLSGSQVIRELPAPSSGRARYGVGWNLPLLGRSREALWMKAEPFAIEAEGPPLETGDEEPSLICAIIPLKLQIADALAFYAHLPGESWSEYRGSELGGEIAVMASRKIQKHLLDYQAGKLLQDDGEIGRRFALLMEEDLRSHLLQRGVRLLEISPLAFHAYEEPSKAMIIVEELKEEARVEVLETVLASLQKLSEASEKDLGDIKGAFLQSREEGQKALEALMARLKVEQEEALAARALQLKALERSQKPPPSVKPVVGLNRLTIYLSLVFILAVISAYLFWFRFSRFQLETGASAAALVFLGMLILIQSMVDNTMSRVLERAGNPLARLIDTLLKSKAQKPAQPPAPAEPAPQPIPAQPAEQAQAKSKREILEDFLRKDALGADNAIRKQASLELSQAVNDLNEIRLKIYRAGDKAKAEALKELASSAESLRLKIAGAPRYEGVVAREWKEKTALLASRLIDFEQELLGQAQVFSLDCGRMLELVGAGASPSSSPANLPTPEKLSAQLRRMERHFSLRDSIFSGLKLIEASK